MININQEIMNEKDYMYEIKTNDGSFRILFARNLDLYWQYLCDSKNIENKEAKEIYITKENYFLYELFDDLYISIKENKLMYNYPYDNEDKDKKIEYNNYPLFKDDKITFISDDGFIQDGSRFIIEKTEQEKYKLKFIKGKISDMRYSTFAIRIRNSGSRYEPLNVVFMNMYNKLKEYDFNNHQILIEEYLYINKNKKKLKKKGK